MTRRSRWVAVAVAGGLVAGAAALALGPLSPPRVPSLAEVRARHRPSEVALLDRHGEAIHELRTDPTRRRLAWTPLAEISPALRAAVLAAEDRRFAEHGGVDARALASAAVGRLTGKPARGASTVSMQLATMLDPGLRRRGGPRSPIQKWRQMRLAWALESRWTKAEILEAYLNLVGFRGELEGVRAAAGIAFGKAPHGITGPEAAVLGALLRAPNADRAAVTRRAVALAARIPSPPPAEAIEAAVARALDGSRAAAPRVALAPHAAQQLLPAWGAGRAAADVVSTLDAAAQQVAAETLRRHLSAVRERHVRDGAVLVVDNERGEVLAYVGGDPDLGSARHVSGIRARRQAGSTLKPFLYAQAIDERLLTPASLLEDTPLEVAVAGGLYRPQNYDGEFKGLVSVRTALASSLNVPAVRALELVGPEAALGRLRRLGFEGLDEAGDFYGPSLALGSADVSLWELVGAYRALANGGVWRPLTMRPLSAEGGARPEVAERRVFSAEAAYVVADVLADRESRSATFGLENPLATRFWTAVKTGTSKEMRDNWCVGFSRRYTVGVWVGNFSGEPMRNVSGVTGAAPIWVEVMSWLHRATPSTPPPPPAGVESRPARFPPGSEPSRREWFVRGTAPAEDAVAGGGQARITSPVSGTIVALDPDIPTDRQRLVLEASGPVSGLRWTVDGRVLGRGDELVVWEPVAGRHAVALVDGGHGVVDLVRLEVRGGRRPRQKTRDAADDRVYSAACETPARCSD